MRRRPILAAALATAVALGPWAHAADPQVIDPTGDANLSGMVLDGGSTSPVGSQPYADIVSTKWENAKKDGKPAFKVTLTLAAPPVPSFGTVVYRVLGIPSNCGFFGVAYYTSKGSDPTQPQSAVRDNCIDATTRLTEIPLPEIKDATLTWVVPLSVIPVDTKITAGSTLTDLFTTVNEIEDFGGPCLPDPIPTYGGACGLGFGEWDRAESTASFKL